MAVVTHIVGGLGNQMFQYAAGRALSFSSGQKLKLDLFSMKNYTRRAFGLRQFNISAEAASAWELPLRRKMSGLPRIKQMLGPGRSCAYVKENGQFFDASLLKLTGPVYLDGYWQSERYFADIEDTIRRDFTLSSDFTPERASVQDEIEKANSISVHVRRGDYVTNPSANAVHGTLNPVWYEAAMSRLADRVEDPVFFVFSDDPAWSRANLPQSWPVVFVEPQADGQDAQDMHLMAACRHHIIANSTFSWWGAWLNPRQDKQVIAPANWFASSSHSDEDLVPGGWERV